MNLLKKIDVPLLSVVVPISMMAGRLANLSNWLIESKNLSVEVVLVHDLKDQITKNELDEMMKYLVKYPVKLYEGNFGSPGLTRNYGLSKVSGTWLVFWDSDDLPNIKKVMEILNTSDLTSFSCVVGSFSIYNEITHESRNNSLSKSFYTDIALTPGIWRFIFRKDSLEGLKFSEIMIAEDQLFLMEYLSVNKNLHIINEDIYTYFIGDTYHLTTKKSAISDLRKSIEFTANFIRRNPDVIIELCSTMFTRQVISAMKHGNLKLKIYAIYTLIFMLLLSQFSISVLILKGIFLVLRKKK
jgi:hypothetical protein